MKTTKRLFDEYKEEFFLNEQSYLQAEREILEQQLMQELFEEEMANRKAKIILGSPAKAGRFEHARIFKGKRPRFINYFRSHNRTVPGSSQE